MQKAHLFMRLAGPLQSWGGQAPSIYRTTERYPTKTGIVGLLACCLGYGPNSPETYQLAGAIRYGVRVESPGTILTDFQTTLPVTSDDPALRSTKANGTSHKTPVPTHRSYLAGADFLVVLEGESATLSRIKAALLDPVWVPFLGRRSCIPAQELYEGMSEEYQGLEEALRRFPWRQRTWRPKVEWPREAQIPKRVIGYIEAEENLRAMGRPNALRLITGMRMIDLTPTEGERVSN